MKGNRGRNERRFIGVSIPVSIIIVMRKKLFLCLFLIPFIGSLNAEDESSVYSQSYVVVIKGKEAGKEIVNEKIDENGNLICTSEHEIVIPASKEEKPRKFKTKMILAKGKLFPISYSYESNEGISYDVKVENSQIISTSKKRGESKESKYPLEPGMLMFDLNVYHTIDYWIRKYDVPKGGLQVLRSYVLPLDQIESLEVSPVKSAKHEYETEVLQLKSYQIEIPDRVTMYLWVNKNNRLYRMFIPGLNIDVIQSDLFDQLITKKHETGTGKQPLETGQ